MHRQSFYCMKIVDNRLHPALFRKRDEARNVYYKMQNLRVVEKPLAVILTKRIPA